MHGHIEQILMDIASTYGFDEQELIPYCYEDTIGGWDHDEGRWPVGSIWSVEGRIIYAVVRTLKPQIAVEIGTYHGCSAEHIAAALRDNGGGKLYCVDNGAWGVEPGHMIAPWALEYIEFVNADGANWLTENADGVGFVFEDGDHSADLCERVWRAAQNIDGGGVVMGHDAMHFLVGNDVRTGILASGIPNPRFYLISPSDCGLAIARVPEAEPVEDVPEETPKPKRRRKPRKQPITETQELEKAG